MTGKRDKCMNLNLNPNLSLSNMSTTPTSTLSTLSTQQPQHLSSEHPHTPQHEDTPTSVFGTRPTTYELITSRPFCLIVSNQLQPPTKLGYLQFLLLLLNNNNNNNNNRIKLQNIQIPTMSKSPPATPPATTEETEP